MRILSISRGLEWSPYAGGEYISATRLAQGLAARGHDVTLLAPRADASGASGPDPSGSGASGSGGRDDSVFRHLPLDHRAELREVAPCRRGKLPFRMWRRMRAAGDLSTYDVVVAHGGEGFCFAAARRFRNGTPLVTVVHTPKLKRPGLFRSRWLAYQQFSARWADRVACLSAYQIDRVAESYGIPSARLAVIGAGVSPELFEPAERHVNGAPLNLLIVGDQSHAKGFDLVLQTLAQLSDHLTFRAAVVGASDDPLANLRNRQRIDQLGLQGHVTLHGQVPHGSMRDHYHGADVFLQPSRRETFGLAVLEAMATGLPCIVLRRGAVPEVVGDAAIIVDGEDATALARAVASLSDPERRRRLGARARERARAFGCWDESARKLETVLQAVVDDPRTPTTVGPVADAAPPR